MNNVVQAENLKQQLKLWIVKVMTSQKYAKYAPAGATIKN
jgi:hypothetical protein